MKKVWNDLVNDGAFARKIARAILVGAGVAGSSAELPIDVPAWLATILIVIGMMIRAGSAETPPATK